MKLHVKRALFSTDNAHTSRLSIFSVLLTIKTSSQHISITLLQIPLKLHEHRFGCWRKTLTWTILQEQFAVRRNTAASKIDNGVISLLWQLPSHCNPDRNKFSSLSNASVVAIFPNLCQWDVVYAQAWEVLTLKDYRATLSWGWWIGLVSPHLSAVRRQKSGRRSSTLGIMSSSPSAYLHLSAS